MNNTMADNNQKEPTHKATSRKELCNELGISRITLNRYLKLAKINIAKRLLLSPKEVEQIKNKLGY